MTLTQEQKQALREKTASARTQSKLPPDVVISEDKKIATFENVSPETFQRSAGLEQANLDPYTDEDGTVRLPEREVANIPWDEEQSFQDAEVGTIKSLVPMNEQAIVEGFAIPPGMDEEKVLDLSSAIYTYIGPIPVHIGRYTNKWFKVLGCCVQPLEGDVVNEQTGEVEHIKWKRPLFKLDKVDPDTEENIIAYGGGIRGLQIARHFNTISGQFGWTVGDFKRPRMFYVQQENRENAHVMYGFRHRACTDEEMSK